MANQKESDLQKRMSMPRQRSAKLEGFDEETKTVTMSFASETPCLDYWGDKEILRCNDEAMDTQRFTDGVMPILYNHERDIVIGKPTKIWTENGRAMATIEFAGTEKAQEIMGLVRDGFLNGVSVGYRVMQWEVVEKGETSDDGIEGLAWIATRWEVFEISIVTVPADGTVGVGRSLPFNANDVELHEAQKEREENMEEKEKTLLMKRKSALLLLRQNANAARPLKTCAANLTLTKNSVKNGLMADWILPPLIANYWKS